MDKISIVVPIYNVEKYLRKCIESILKQTYYNLEIILVDDGSTDSSGEICDEYKNKDSRIIVIHQKNKGMSSARNSGIKCATGKYIGFIDSDDYIEKDMYEILLKNIIDYSADIAICGFAFVENNKVVPKEFTGDINVLDRQTALEELIKDRKIQSYVWNKLYKREIWNNITFKSGVAFEDLDIMYKLFKKAKKIAIVDSLKYFYVQRSNSIMHIHNSKYILDRINVVIGRYNDFKTETNKRLQFVNKYAFAVNMIMIYRKIILENYEDVYDEFMKYYDLFIEIINENEFEIRKILTKNQNLVLDFMLEDLATAPEKIRSVKDIDK